MTPDPRWLEILKASGWQTGMLALVLLVFILLMLLGAIPSEPWMVTLAAISCLVCVGLWLASMGEALQPKLRRRLAIRQAKQRFTNYLPYMAPRERQIFAYLLHRKQKVFDCAADYGHAASLAGQGFIVDNIRAGSVFDHDHLPVKVPDYVWEVLEANRGQFPYEPDLTDGVEVHPWRRHWAE